MSSSCVPPKNCVVHDPDPSSHDDHSDSGSECGSLCTCTSSSMTSLATASSNRALDTLGQRRGSSVSLVASPSSQPSLQQATDPAGTLPATQTSDSSGNSYFPMVVPQQVSNRDCSRCGVCRSILAFTVTLRHMLLTISEFFPWIAGVVIIYYSYYWWGIGSGFSAFLFMIGAHAVLRLIKTRGVLGCIPYSSQRQGEGDSQSEDEGEEAETDSQQGTPETSVDLSLEKPPSYDVAVVKPPPYDLQCHLTPKIHGGLTPSKQQLRSSTNRPVVSSRQTTAGRAISSTTDEGDDMFLPSYHDAIGLAFCNDKNSFSDQLDNQDRHQS